ncbi:MAG: hypothetical protein RMX98_010650 [Nostoc sp. DedQUE02]|nr:hypothetical protein [Nostoc sp. DedQUE02]
MMRYFTATFTTAIVSHKIGKKHQKETVAFVGHNLATKVSLP